MLAALGSCGQQVTAPAASLATETRPVAPSLPVRILAEKMSASIDSTEAALETGWANSAGQGRQLSPDTSGHPGPKALPKQALMQASRPAVDQAGV